MLPSSVDTIVAIATAQGRGGVGVIRVSGRGVDVIAQDVLGRLPRPRRATYSDFLGEDGEVIDQGIALYFPAPNSYTGEEVLELQGHGGMAVLQLLLKRCLELGARYAEPGEFTQRAYLNNKMDLAQAESVADLIDANTTEAARSAMRSLRGEFSAAIHALNDKLIHLRMLVEAMLDFPEEEVDDLDVAQRDGILNDILKALQHTLEAAKQGALLREGAYVVIAGQPNVGKSSLLNRLSGEEVALVSDVPGTTRDVIRQAVQIKGVPLHVMDTAGLRDAADVVESMGIERTHQTLHKADLVLLLLDATKGLTEKDREIMNGLPSSTPRLIVLNKTDLVGTGSQVQNLSGPTLLISAKTGAGLDELKEKILELVGWRDQESGTYMARERHLNALRQANQHLLQAAESISNAELMAEELRQAQMTLGSITGEFTADDLLGEIFSRFCIGK